jgi:spectinomycin phosphotransferase
MEEIMLEKPDLQDEKIIACLHDSYGLTITNIEFLPLGYDAYAAVYRVIADDGQPYFLKARKDARCEHWVRIPRYLKDQGLEQVVAPLPTTTQELWGTVEHFTLILYPFIEGEVGMEVGLSDSQWTAFGAFLKQLHTTRLPSELMEQLPKEDFVPNRKWTGVVRQLQAEVQHRDYDNPFEKELAAFWRTKHEEIGKIVDRAEQLGRLLQNKPLEFVLCHGDIHTANLLLSPDEKLWVVDWDQPILAPKERDLMFVVGTGAREGELFFRGYGETDVDSLVLAYYRYEWVVQDMGDFAERVFLTPATGDETKQDSVQGFMARFELGDVVEAAYASDNKF